MSDPFIPAAEMAALRRPPLPGETAAYAKAREALLAEEIELRRHASRIAEQRRALPAGPVVEKDYRFLDANGAELGLIDLFGAHDTLLTFFWMFGPQRARPCPMCTNFLGPINANVVDVEQWAAFKVIGRSPVARQLAFARGRGWTHLDFVQSCSDDYARDIGALTPEGAEMGALVVYRRDGDRVRLFWADELSEAMADPGQDPRGEMEAPLWDILDLTPKGRDPHWYPKLSY